MSEQIHTVPSRRALELIHNAAFDVERMQPLVDFVADLETQVMTINLKRSVQISTTAEMAGREKATDALRKAVEKMGGYECRMIDGMDEHPDGDWLQRHDVLALFNSTEKE